MGNCLVCQKEIQRGKRYIGTRYKNISFCSEECYNNYLRLKESPKPPINYKPLPNTPRRQFTDYLQEWSGDNINWNFVMSQAKDIMEEFELSWKDMFYVLKYCRVYENIEWNNNYGLRQLFPKYIKPMQDFTEAIMLAKQVEDIEDEINYVRKPKQFIGKVEF